MKKPPYLKHAWYTFRRSPALTQNLIQTLLLAFFGFYFAVSFLVMSLVAGELIREFFPDRDTIGMAGAILLYYLPIDILSRYFLQKFPTLVVQPYMLLPVSKSSMVHYLLRRSMLGFFNFLPIFLTLPFLFVEVIPNSSGIETLGFCVLVIGLIFTSNYVSYWVSKASDFNNSASIGLLIGLFSFLFLEFKGVTAFFTYLESAAIRFMSTPLMWIIPFAIVAFLYTYLFRYFKKHLTAEKEESESSYLQNISLGYFGRFGRAGKLMDLELRLLLRSKRARSYLMTSVVILFLPLFMGISETELPEVNYIIFGLLMTGMIALNHGQLMLSWNSLHFDLLMSRGNTIHDIFKAKYFILALSCVVTYLLTLPYLFLDPNIVLFNTAMLFINTSISIYSYMILASYNSLRIDPDQGNTFSFSGFGAAHYLIGIPIMVLPLAIYFIPRLVGGMTAGLLALFIVGVGGTVFYRQVINSCVKLFNTNRYKIAAAFRKE